jgi:hypothetical protein
LGEVCSFFDFSQFYWEKYVRFLTSPNFFGRCQAKVGRCHNKLGEVIFFPMTESALKVFIHTSPNLFWEKYVCFLTSPNFFGGSMFFLLLLQTFLGEVCLFFWLLPTFLGEVCFICYFSQLFWEKYVCFLTSPNYFGRCKGNVGRCHIVHRIIWWLYKKVGRSLDKCVTPTKSFSP